MPKYNTHKVWENQKLGPAGASMQKITVLIFPWLKQRKLVSKIMLLCKLVGNILDLMEIETLTW